MASTYTDLGLELMATGENAGTWGTKTNANLSLIEQLTGGVLSISIAGGAGTQALTIADGALTGTAQHRILEFTGTISGNRIITFPLLTETFYIIKNGTSGSHTVQLKAVSGSGATVTFATGDKGYKLIYLDGVATNTGVFEAPLGEANEVTLTGTETLTNKTLTDPKLSPTATTAGKIEFLEGTNNGTNIATLIGPAATADVTVTLPASTDTLVGKNTTDTLTNKTINASQLVDASIATGKVADDAITLAKMAPGTDGNLISYDASGNPVAVATGNDGQILTSTGAGSPPVFEDAASGGVTFKEGGTNFTRSLLVGDDSTGTLSSANDNTGVGTNVFSALTSGVSNIAIGSFAMCANTTGFNNIAIGLNALCTNTTGCENIAIGNNALRSATTSGDAVKDNIALGFCALICTTIGPRNIAIGTEAMKRSVSVEDAVAVGFQAMCCNTANCSVAFGRGALQLNTSGMNNTALGHVASRCNTTGEANVAVGTFALHKNTTSSFNTATGACAIFCSTTGDCNTSTGWCSLARITTGDNNIGIGYKSGASASTGLADITTQSNYITLGNTSHTNAYIKIDWTVTSDLRDKTEIKNVTHGLDFINQITPIEYRFKKSRENETPTGDKKYGFKAQEILELEGDNPVIINNKDTDNLKLTNAHLIPVLVNAIKELKAEIDELKNK